jgi:hypothetical protein
MPFDANPNLAQAASQSFDRTAAGLKTGIASATQIYNNVSEKAAKTAADLTAFNQGTFEAFTQAGQILATEAQDLFRQMASSSQTAFSEGLTNVRALASAKTVKERLELQATIARTAAIWTVTETSRFAQAGIALAEKASAPVTARAYLAAEKFSIPSA